MSNLEVVKKQKELLKMIERLSKKYKGDIK